MALFSPCLWPFFFFLPLIAMAQDIPVKPVGVCATPVSSQRALLLCTWQGNPGSSTEDSFPGFPGKPTQPLFQDTQRCHHALLYPCERSNSPPSPDALPFGASGEGIKEKKRKEKDRSVTPGKECQTFMHTLLLQLMHFCIGKVLCIQIVPPYILFSRSCAPAGLLD